jgi:hypothetical protein
MKVQTISAQAWWIALADEIRPVNGLDVAAVFAAIKERFEFAAIPTAPAQQGGGLDFVNGALRATPEPVIINKISIYTDGLNVEVPTTTERAEIVLQEALNVFFSFGVRRPETSPLHYYLSTIVVDFEHSLDNLIPARLLKKVEASIDVEAKTHFAGLNINADKTTLGRRLGPINPTFFNIHRRVDVPYDQNRYFSQANMGTPEHLDALAEFEQLAGRAK